MTLLTVPLRKLNSARVRARRWVQSSRARVVAVLVSWLTERFWLIDKWPVKKAAQGSVVLVRLDLVGDFVIWLDSAQAYRMLYPNQRMVLYANSIWADLAKNFDCWDEVIAVDVPRLRSHDGYRLKQLIKLRRRGFSVAIQPTYSREYVADLCVRATNAPERIGHLGNLSNIAPDKKQVSDRWYTQLVDLGQQAIVELNLNAAFVRALGHSSFKSTLPRIDQRHVLPRELQIAEAYFVVVPGASWALRRWPAAHFAATAQTICQQLGLTMVLCGTGAESQLCDDVEQLAQVPTINLAGRTTVNELVEVIRGAKLLIANESAAIHLATAAQTPSVCIFGGGHFGRFLPYSPERETERPKPTVMFQKLDCYGCNWHCKFLTPDVQTVPCIAAVDPAAVASACLKLATAW